MNKVYIRCANQISIQQPLCDDWMRAPQPVSDTFQQAVDPVFRDYLNPMKTRRFGLLLKRALVTAQRTMKECGISRPDAIIMGTALGCIADTEYLLAALNKDGEDVSQPTHFMQSTHNTISSLISIQTGTHGYNNTYSQRSISFESALLDAFVQIRLGKINNALVCSNDEITPTWFDVVSQTSNPTNEKIKNFTEGSVAMILTNTPDHALCELEDIDISYSKYGHLDDTIYGEELFGHGYATPSLGIYAAAKRLSRGECEHVVIKNISEHGKQKSSIILSSVL